MLIKSFIPVNVSTSNQHNKPVEQYINYSLIL